MGVHSGKFSRVNGVSTMRNWSIEDRITLPRGYASNTAFGPVRNKGIREWTGQVAAYGAQPAILPGEVFTFLGYGAPADDVSGNGQTYTGDAIVDQVVINWDWRSGEKLAHSVNFSGHLELEYPAGADPGDAVDPDMPPVCGLNIQWENGSAGWVDLPYLTSAALTLTSQNLAYTNSSTVANGHCWRGRKAGVIDATLSISQEDDERVTGIFDIGDEIALRLYTSDTEFWEIYWMRVAGFTGIRADRESGAIIARTINLELNGFGGSGAMGYVAMPDTTLWWPPA